MSDQKTAEAGTAPKGPALVPCAMFLGRHGSRFDLLPYLKSAAP